MDIERGEAVSEYERDFHEWLTAQAAAIREGRWADVDVENLTEEIDGLARSDRHQIASRLIVLMAHLLKQEAQPERNSRSWRVTILTQARDLNLLLSDSPSLRAKLSVFVTDNYERARRQASTETDLPLDAFPPTMTDNLRARLTDALAQAK